jgi:hypothetical protein
LSSVASAVAVPRYLRAPTSATNASEDIIGLADSAGLHLDEAEQLVLRAALGERVDGTWAASQVGLVVPRQNLKTWTLGADALGSIFVLKIPLIMWTAHRFSTAIEAWRWMRAVVTNYDHLRRRVQGVRRTTWGGGEIELVDGCRILFGSRSNGATGRGFSIDKLYFDEAFDLTDDDLAALLPALSARPNHQVWYASSAPKPHSAVLRRICEAGRAGVTPGLAYVEWSAPDSAASDDPAAWAAANPSYGMRRANGSGITEETIRSELATMSDGDFRRERLGIWDPVDGQAIDMGRWRDLQDAGSRRAGGATAVGVAVTPLRDAAAVVAFGSREDGLGHGQLVRWASGVDWVPSAVAELLEACRPALVGMTRATAASLERLTEAGITPPEDAAEPEHGNLITLAGPDSAAACSQLLVAVREGSLRVVPAPDLDAAVAGAQTRVVGDGVTWARQGMGTEAAPLEALTVARWVHATKGHLLVNDYDPVGQIF